MSIHCSNDFFCFVHPTWPFQVMNYVDIRLKHRRIGSLLGLEKEAVDNFCSVWWLLEPQEMKVELLPAFCTVVL